MNINYKIRNLQNVFYSKNQSIKIKIRNSILIIPIALIFILFLYNVAFIQIRIKNDVKLNRISKKETLLNNLDLIRESYKSQCNQIAYNVNVIVPLFYDVMYQVQNELLNSESAKDFDEIIIFDKNRNPIVSNKSNKKDLIKSIFIDKENLENQDVLLRKINSKIFVCYSLKLLYKGQHIGYIQFNKNLEKLLNSKNLFLLIDGNISSKIPENIREKIISEKIIRKLSSDKIVKIKNYYIYGLPILNNEDKEIGSVIIINDTTQRLKKAIWDWLILSAILLFVTIIIILWVDILASSISNPIIKLSKLSEQITAGSYADIYINYDKNDEISILYKNFKKMVSELLQSNEELLKAKEKAEESSRLKSEFLANISHEIRTPLNSVLGFADLLDSLIQDEMHRQYVNNIQSSAKHLLTLINDILDLSKIEAGKLKIVPEKINIYNLVNEVRDIFILQAKQKDLELTIECDKRFPESILFDGIRLRQILVNLIGNAIKFTEKGFIKVSCKILTIDENKNDIEITIQDSGIGIAKNQLNIIFDSFTQQDGQSSRKYGGTGLGLAITKKLVTMMNGEIFVKSELNKGTTFTVLFHNLNFEINDKQDNPHIETTIYETHNNEAPLYEILIEDNLSIQDIENILEELNGGLSRRFYELQEFSSMELFNEFANKIVKLGSEYECQSLLNYGNEFLQAVDYFNIQKIEILLNGFPNILKKFEATKNKLKGANAPLK